MNNLVEFVEMERITDWVVREDVFCVTPARGWMPVQRLCFWILRKLQCHWSEKVSTVRRHVINPSSFTENLHRQNKGLLEHAHQQGRHILIGSGDFAALMDSQEIGSRFSFSAPYSYAENGRVSIFGMRVTIIPWMKGMLVMPGER